MAVTAAAQVKRQYTTATCTTHVATKKTKLEVVAATVARAAIATLEAKCAIVASPSAAATASIDSK